MNSLESISEKFYSLYHKSGSILIDINLDEYTDLYNERDFSPHKKRDMDEDLFNYIISCSTEIPLHKKIIIRMNLPEEIRCAEKENNAVIGVHRYIKYCLEKNGYLRKKALRSMLHYGIAGVLFLSLSVYLPVFFNIFSGIHLLKEGLIIGGWVLFWECFEIVFFKDALYREKRKHLKRLNDSEISFNYHKKG